MHPIVAWMIGAAYISYRWGWQCKMLPLPHRYIALTAFTSISAIVAMANETVGALFAYGSLLGMVIYGYQTGKIAINEKPKCDSVKSSGPGSPKQQSGQSSGQSGSQTQPHPTPTPGPAPSVSGYLA